MSNFEALFDYIQKLSGETLSAYEKQVFVSLSDLERASYPMSRTGIYFEP